MSVNLAKHEGGLDKVYYDIEAFRNLFVVEFRFSKEDLPARRVLFEISSFKNQLSDFCKFLEGVVYKKHLLGFNNLHYDDVLLAFIYTERERFKDLEGEQIAEEIYEFSESIIMDYCHPRVRRRYRLDTLFPDRMWSIDLFQYWSKQIRMVRMISLKSLAASNGYPNLNEFEFIPYAQIDEFQRREVYSYLENDVSMTEFLDKKVLFKELSVRATLSEQYGANYLAMDGVKIGTEMLFDAFSKKTGVKSKDNLGTDRGKIRVGDILPTNIQFTSPALKEVHEYYKGLEIDLSWDAIEQAKNDRLKGGVKKKSIFKQSVRLNDLHLSFGIGGLHSKDKKEILRPSDNVLLVQTDAKSYYPNLMANYECLSASEGSDLVDTYRSKIQERFAHKDEANRIYKLLQSGEYDSTQELALKDQMFMSKFWSEVLKLLLNGVSGNLKNKFSWLRDPAANVKMTCSGQLFLAMLADTCFQNNFRVLSVNTDGIECYVPVDRYQEYVDICGEWERTTKFELEHDCLDYIFRESISDYFAVLDGKCVKRKGAFKKPEPHEPISAPIISDAIIDNTVSGVPVEDVVRGCNDMLKFCYTPRMGKKFRNMIGDREIYRYSRIYASTADSAGKSYKVDKVSGRETTFAVGQTFNDANVLPLDRKPFDDIDYDHYVRLAKKRIGEVTQHGQYQFAL